MRNASSCFLLVLAALALQHAPAAAQVISVDPMSFDFGDMGQQQTRTATVTVKNEGAGLLRILDVKADCGCTVPTLAKDQLGPGESTQIEIQFNSKLFFGTVIKAIKIMSNDPDSPQIDVVIKAEVHASLLIDPITRRLGFTTAQEGEVLTRSVTFTAVEEPELKISVDKTKEHSFVVDVVNNYEGNPQVALLEVTVPADMAPGRHLEHVKVKTNIEDMSEVEIEMKVRVAQTVIVGPEQVSFRYKQTFRRVVRVSPLKAGTVFKVTGAEIDLPEITVEVLETIPNVETHVILEGGPISSSDPRAQESNGHIKGTLTIYTDHPGTPFIKVPVTYMVRL